MSHYTLLVVIDKEDKENIDAKLNKLLEPYQELYDKNDLYTEFESSREEVVEQFNKNIIPVIFKKCSDGSVKLVGGKYDRNLKEIDDLYKVPKNGDRYSQKELCLTEEYFEKEIAPSIYYKDITHFSEEWFGYKTIRLEDGKLDFGNYSNKNAKWDWWTVGGRWKNKWKSIDSSKNSEGVDIIIKKNIDIKKMSTELDERIKEEWALWEDLKSKGKIYSFAEIRDRILKENNMNIDTDYSIKRKFIDEAREEYNNQEQIKEIKDLNKKLSLYTNDVKDYFANDVFEDFVLEHRYNIFGTYSILDKDGWKEKGKMIAFGTSLNEKESWRKEWFDFFEKLDDESILINIDCHI